MRYAKIGICLLAMLPLLSVSLFAAPYVEDFSGPLPGEYCSVYNLIPLVDDVGKTLYIEGKIDDESMYRLTPESACGGVVIYTTGVQNVRVGFYSRYGIYAAYNAATNRYEYTHGVVSGRTKRMKFDHATQTMCVQDENMLYTMFYDSILSYLLVPNNNTALGEHYYPYFGANIYISQDNVSYLPVMSRPITYKTGADISTTETTVYCELEAAVPAGYRYIRVEMNRPTHTYMEASLTSRVSAEESFQVYLSRITLNGDTVKVLSDKSTSSNPPTSSQSPEKIASGRGESEGRTGDYSASYQPDVIIGDIDGIGYQQPGARQSSTQQPSAETIEQISDEVLAAEIVGDTEPGVTAKDEVVNDFNGTIAVESKTSSTPTGFNITEVICLIVGAIGVAAFTYSVTKRRTNSKEQMPAEGGKTSANK